MARMECSPPSHEGRCPRWLVRARSEKIRCAWGSPRAFPTRTCAIERSRACRLCTRVPSGGWFAKRELLDGFREVPPRYPSRGGRPLRLWLAGISLKSRALLSGALWEELRLGASSNISAAVESGRWLHSDWSGRRDQTKWENRTSTFGFRNSAKCQEGFPFLSTHQPRNRRWQWGGGFASKRGKDGILFELFKTTERYVLFL